MHAHKFSISLTDDLASFMQDYQQEHHCKSRSDVIQKALALLRQKHLEHAYRAANKEINDDFDVTLLDGLEDDETW